MNILSRGGRSPLRRMALAMAAVFAATGAAAAEPPSAGPYARWQAGPSRDTHFFPIAVWLQDPRNAKRYQELGINLYVGLWKGPTSAQLAALKAAGMRVICAQNETGLRDPNRDIIVGWMHDDEPDNAQSLGEGRGYGPPVPPERVAADYRRMAQADPSRPVLLNLGQGVAWDGWHGRGVRTNHPEDYPAYLEGCDIASFDIYPVTHDKPAVAGKLEFVARGVTRLHEWSRGRRIIWNCIECTRISNVQVKPTPAQVRSEVWMSLIHGSQGLIYFVHQFKPAFVEAGLLADPEMARAVGVLNRQIHELAPVLNRPSQSNLVQVASTHAAVPVAFMVKRTDEALYIFATAMRADATTATFAIGTAVAPEVEVLGEGRTLPLKESGFTDEFGPYGVRLYRIGLREAPRPE